MSIDVSAGIEYKKKVIEHILKIETDEFDLCKTKVIKKRKWLLSQEVFTVHVFPDKHIELRKLK